MSWASDPFARGAARRARWALALLLLALPLRAQQGGSDAERDAARALGKQAQLALKRGDFAAARDLFEQAERLYHAPTLLLGLARAHAGLGKLVAAREAYLRLPRSLPADAPPAFQKAIEAAQQELIDLEARLPKVVLQIEGADDAILSLDGALHRGPLGEPWPVDPGTHEIRATSSGRLQTARFEAREGAVSRVELRFSPPESPPASPAAPAASPSAPSPSAPAPGTPEAAALPPLEGRTRWQRPAGYAALGVGVAGLATSGVFGLVALSRRDTLLGRCGGTICPEAERDLHGDFLSSLRWANVAAAVGGVGILVGVPLLLTAPGKPRQASLCLPGASLGLCGVFLPPFAPDPSWTERSTRGPA